MNEPFIPVAWPFGGVATAITAPLAGAAVALVARGRRPRAVAVVSAGISLAASLAATVAWQAAGGRPLTAGGQLGGGFPVHLDGLSMTLLPFVALIELTVVLVAPRRALEPAAIARTLFGFAATMALFATSHPAALVGLWVVTVIPTWLSTRATPGGRAAARVFAIAMALSIVAISVGTGLMMLDPPWVASSGTAGMVGGWLVAVAVLIRKGIMPFHSWYPALFTGAPMATALTATMPQVAAYTAVRLLIGHADHADGVAQELVVVSQLALVTAAYGAALCLVQRDLRGFIGTLAMSQSALVLAGLSGTLPMELNGALCIWISSGLAITGIGLVTWAIESRGGAISLETLQGRFADAPELAAFFLLFGMAGIGMPGTLSFVANDLIISGGIADQLHAGLLMIVTTVLSGIGVMRCWFRVFGGPAESDGPRHAILRREKIPLAFLLITLGGLGIYPGPLVTFLERAAAQLLEPVDAPSVRSAPSSAKDASHADP